ncbi:CD225/dispanin family protein [Panacibacter sp. DH6]|uniref:CD225/dispanin family protein n=1 Tax=Panacibacter microcysteis TaxID=2793269 RepID=A0A931E8J3_9BACT|nr:CD225/dispanin family protein [Panacibacter microcysteis]MBG9377093.1 CD225/dispanin family protein [Panacibacter microcysteis]
MENYSNQPYQQQPVSPPKNWLVEAILVTIFCCQIIGIVAIVFAAQVNSKFAAGDYAGAQSASKDAGKWTKIAFFVGIAWVALCLLWIFFWGGLAMMSNRYGY